MDFEPYLPSPDFTAISIKGDSGFFKQNQEIGGVVSQDTIIPYSASAYIVTEDIIIPFGVTLSVEPGVVLNFLGGGITVHGNL